MKALTYQLVRNVLVAIALMVPTDATADSMSIPFAVSLDGNLAATPSDNSRASVIEIPVPADAKVFVDAKSAQIMMDVIAVGDSLQPLPGQTSAIVTLTNGEGSLGDTDRPLAPGRYLASIIANGKNAKVLFEVK